MKRASFYPIGAAALGLALGAAFALRLSLRDSEIAVREANVSAAVDRNHRMMTSLQRLKSGAPNSSEKRPPVREPGTAAKSGRADNLDRGYLINKLLRDMPEYAPILRREVRRTTMQQYGDFFALLNLSPERLERLKGILDERWVSLQDARYAANEQGFDPSRQPDRVYSRLMDDLIAKADGDLRQLLNRDEYKRYSQFEKLRGWQSAQLPEIEDYFALSSVPTLSARQKQSLGEAYLDVQKWKPDGAPVAPGMLFRLRNDEFVARAGNAVDPQQQAALAAFMKFVNAREDTTARLFFPDDPDRHVVSIHASRH